MNNFGLDIGQCINEFEDNLNQKNTKSKKLSSKPIQKGQTKQILKEKKVIAEQINPSYHKNMLLLIRAIDQVEAYARYN